MTFKMLDVFCGMAKEDQVLEQLPRLAQASHDDSGIESMLSQGWYSPSFSKPHYVGQNGVSLKLLSHHKPYTFSQIEDTWRESGLGCYLGFFVSGCKSSEFHNGDYGSYGGIQLLTFERILGNNEVCYLDGNRPEIPFHIVYSSGVCQSSLFLIGSNVANSFLNNVFVGEKGFQKFFRIPNKSLSSVLSMACKSKTISTYLLVLEEWN